METGRGDKNERRRLRKEEVNLGAKVSDRPVIRARNRESKDCRWGGGWIKATDVKEKSIRGKERR